jgi:hypothetical protein
VKVFNPLTGKALSTKAQGKYVAFEMDPFVLYSIVVLEAKRR